MRGVARNSSCDSGDSVLAIRLWFRSRLRRVHSRYAAGPPSWLCPQPAAGTRAPCACGRPPSRMRTWYAPSSSPRRPTKTPHDGTFRSKRARGCIAPRAPIRRRRWRHGGLTKAVAWSSCPRGPAKATLRCWPSTTRGAVRWSSLPRSIWFANGSICWPRRSASRWGSWAVASTIRRR